MKSRFSIAAWAIVFIGIALVMAIYSVHWITPLLENPGLPSNSFPIIYGPTNNAGGGDEYFYYSYVREILDGHWFSFSDDLAGKNNPSIYSSYFISILLGSLGGLIRNSVSDAFFFNATLFPFLSFILVFLFLRQYSKKTPLLNLFLAYICFFYDAHLTGPLQQLREAFHEGILAETVTYRTQVHRFPNIMVTGAYLFAFVFSLFNFERSKRWKVTFSILLGLSNLVSTATCMIVAWTTFVYGLSLWNQKPRFKEFARFLIYGILISLPGFYKWSQSMRSPLAKNFPRVAFNTAPEEFKKFKLQPTIDHLKMYWRFIPVFFLPFAHRRKTIASVCGLALAYLFVAFTQGNIVADKVFYRGGVILFYTLLAGSYLACIALFLERDSVKKIMNRKDLRLGLNVLGLTLGLFTLMGLSLDFLKEHKATSHAQYHRFSDNQIGLFDWLKSNAQNDDVLLTLDFDLLTHLPVYSPINVYTPSLLRSPYDTETVLARYLESLKFYGVSSGKVRELFQGMRSHDLTGIYDFYGRELRFMQLVLYYSQFSDGLPANELNRILERYETAPGATHFTHLLVGPFEKMMALPKQGHGTVVYENSDYALIKL